VLNLNAGSLGYLRREQLEWLEQYLRNVSSSTPIVVSPNTFVVCVSGVWLGYRRQTLRKFEGGVSFHTALSTAFPQPAPGTPGASPGPITVPVDHLRSVLGITDVSVVRGQDALAVTDLTLAETGAAMMHPTEMESRQ
jgi:Icc protein